MQRRTLQEARNFNRFLCMGHIPSPPPSAHPCHPSLVESFVPHAWEEGDKVPVAHSIS